MAYQIHRQQIKAQTDDARKNELKNQIIQKQQESVWEKKTAKEREKESAKL